MNCPTNEAIDHALSVLAHSLNNEHRPNYNFFASNAFGSAEELDREVQFIKTVQSGLNDRISTIIRQRYAYRNNIASRIYNIPLDIFTHILSASIDMENWSIKHLNNLARVSKYWATTVLSTPELWTVVKYNTSEYKQRHLWEQALKKSKQLPISCQLYVRSWQEFRKNDGLALDRISDESHRWRSIDFRGVMNSAIVWFLESPCPKLESPVLKITNKRPNTPINVEIPFGNHLHSVRLEDFSLRWDKCALHDLRTLSLRLESWETDGGPLSQQVLAILSGSPRLEVLELADGNEAYWEGDPLSPKDVQQIAKVDETSLSSLRTLKILNLPAKITFAIFMRVHAPYIDNFYWECRNENFTAEWLSLHPLGTVQTVPGHLLSYITSGDIKAYLKPGGTGRCEFNIKADGEDNEGVTRKFETKLLRFQTSYLRTTFDLLMIDSVVAPLSLNIGYRGWDDPFPPSLLDNLQAIRKLELNCISNTVEILSYLSNRSGPGERWPCPMMTHLAIRSSDELPLDAVTSFRNARYPDRSTSDTMDADEGLKEFPVPLESLLIPNILFRRLVDEAKCILDASDCDKLVFL